MLTSFISFVYILSLVCWVGGIIFFSFFTAPVIFKFLDREKAGELTGCIFPKYYLLGYICATLALVSLLVSAQNYFEVKQVLLSIMIVAWFYAGLVVSPKSKHLKAQRKSTISIEEYELIETRFKKMHSLAVKLNGLVLFTGLGLLWFSAEGLKL